MTETTAPEATQPDIAQSAAAEASGPVQLRHPTLPSVCTTVDEASVETWIALGWRMPPIED